MTKLSKKASSICCTSNHFTDTTAGEPEPTLARQIGCYNSYRTEDYMVRTILLDTGCDSSLSHSMVNQFLINPRESKIKIFGFSGNTPVSGDKHGTLQAYVMGDGNMGTSMEFETDTLDTLNQDLMSLTQWYKVHQYDLVLQHKGFSGLYKRDKSTGAMTNLIPVQFDPIRNQWIFHVIIAADFETARRAGKIMEQQRKGNSTDTIMDAIVDNGTTMGGVLDLHRDVDFLTLRNAGDVVLTRSSEIGGVIEYCTQIGDSQFFAQSAYQQFHEMYYTETISVFTAGVVRPDEACMAGVKAGMPNREKRMTAEEFHKTHGHIGHMDKCEICLKLKKTLRRVYKETDPYKDKRIGYAFSMDGITWSDPSKQGNRYTVVLRDMGSSGYIVALHLAHKSDSCERIRNLKREFNRDPRFELISGKYGHKPLSEIRTDPAGEWREDNKEWQAMCKEEGITMVYTSPDDKRNSAHAENTVGMVERGAKAILMQTSAPVNYIEYAVDQFVLMHNCFPQRADVESSDGDAPRPLEKISCGRISRRQCDKIIHHCIPVGTPCLVTIPHVRGSDITNVARCRWLIAIKQYGDLPIFECPYTGQHVRSKGYVAFHLKEGTNAWSFLGITPPKLGKSYSKSTDDLKQFIQLDITTTQILQKPVVEKSKARKPDHMPQVITVDNDGTVYVPDSNGQLVPTDDKIPSLAKTQPQNTVDQQIQIDIDMLRVDPHRFMGHHAYKHFKGTGIIHGIVSDANCNPDGTEVLWEVTYDDGDSQLYDHDDMVDFVIRHIHGTELRSEMEAAKFLNIEPELPFGGLGSFKTENNDTFIDVCEKIGIPKSEWRQYYNWLQEFHNYGHNSDTEQDGLKFRLPWAGDGKLKFQTKQTRFEPDTEFPIPSGLTWDEHRSKSIAISQSQSNPDKINADICRSLDSKIYELERINARATTQYLNTGDTFWNQVRLELGMEPEMVHANASKLTPDLLKLVEQNEYKDPTTGRIIPPSSVNDAKRRSDWPLWKHAIDVELGSLDKLGVFSHDHTLKELRDSGVYQSPVPQKMIFDAKYDPEGNFVKPKARNCIAGHKGVMRKGEHFWATFAAAPRTDTTRVLQALAAGKGYHRAAFDISVAFCQADCREYEKIPLRYPPGMERYNENGERLYAVLERNLYGSPAAARRWCEARNKWMLDVFNRNGWKCRKMRYDPCLFRMDTPQGTQDHTSFAGSIDQRSMT